VYIEEAEVVGGEGRKERKVRERKEGREDSKRRERKN
jgi:hypothetical protein